MKVCELIWKKCVNKQNYISFRFEEMGKINEPNINIVSSSLVRVHQRTRTRRATSGCTIDYYPVTVATSHAHDTDFSYMNIRLTRIHSTKTCIVHANIQEYSGLLQLLIISLHRTDTAVQCCHQTKTTSWNK